MSEYKNITLAVEDGVGVVTFNRPEVRNALNHEMVDDIHLALTRLQREEGLKAVIFTGAGEKSFISGADISELRDRVAGDALLRINTGLFREIENFPVPTIAAVRGYALGGGCELAMACDLRVAGEGAKFGQPEVGLGIIPGAGGTYRLARLVGIGMARELVFTGRIIDSATAASIGLVNRVVPDADVLSSAQELAGEIAKNSGIALRFAKLALNATHEMSSDVGMLVESTAQAVLFEDDEKRQRMTAFLERKKRK